MKAMETLQHLIEEAKLRTVWWALCIFSLCYFLSHTSKSMWMNVPISLLLVSGFRILFNEVEFTWKVQNVRQQTYLSHLEKKQLSVNDSRLSTSPPLPKWKRKIDSPPVKAAMEDFINKLLQDFVADLWYSDITPDEEAPERIRAVIMDVLGEIAGRGKQINLVDLLTRDLVDLIGDHLDLFRRNQTAIGVEVMGTLSSEERDERLKYHLMASKELHPSLISPECEYKVLQRLIGGVLAIVLRPREAQCPLVRCIARELLTCLVIQPIMNFASPEYINELIEYIFLANKDGEVKEVGDDQSHHIEGPIHDHTVAADRVRSDESSFGKDAPSYNQATEMTLSSQRKASVDAYGNSFSQIVHGESMQPRPADWARILEAAAQRRTEVLMPDNLENMWTKGRNYKKKVQKSATAGLQVPVPKGSVSSAITTKDIGKEITIQKPKTSNSTRMEDKALVQLPPKPRPDTRLSDQDNNAVHLSRVLDKDFSFEGGCLVDDLEDTHIKDDLEDTKSRLKRSNNTSDLKVSKIEDVFTNKASGSIISEFYSPDFGRHGEVHEVKTASDVVRRGEGSHVPKLKCRVIGAYFEKLGSKSFAVYSIAVTDADKSTWFVKRRYRNFERLHRHLKDIPNYTIQLPPKRIFSSSTEDTFVHQRCIQLDKYLQDLLSIANVAEQHEVCDFLSVSSKNYSFGKSPSVMKTLAVNVDDAVDDIVRQFKGVSDGLTPKVIGPSSTFEPVSSVPVQSLSWNSDAINKLILRQNTTESASGFSDNDEADKNGSHGHEEIGSNARDSGWHSDNEVNSKVFPLRVVKHDEEFRSLDSGKKHGCDVEPMGVPPEWAPPNLSVPVLNLVDTIFQLKRRGWLRRQVFWISKQILQLMMEDAIDDWLLRQIHMLHRDDIIAQGIRWVQDVLWPDGKFFRKLNTQSDMDDYQPNQRSSSQTSNHLAGRKVSGSGSFEQQLEAARRASDVKKMIFNGAPTTLVSLIGHKQYKRCAKDIYYFLQSTICLKQLGYGILELLLITVFPEMRDIVLDVHEKMHAQPV